MVLLLDGSCDCGTFPPTKSAFVFKSKELPSAVNACVSVPVGVLNPVAFIFPFTSSFSVAEASGFPTPIFPVIFCNLSCLSSGAGVQSVALFPSQSCCTI